MRSESAVEIGHQLVQEVRRQNLPFLAGSLAFHAFISLLPLLLLLLVVVSTVAGDFLVEYVLELTRLYLSPSGQHLLTNAVVGVDERASESIIGLLVLLWAGFRIFWGIDVVFTQLYGTAQGKGALRKLRDGLAGLVAVEAAVVLITAAGTVVTLVPAPVPLDLFTPLLLLVGLLVAFFPVYYLFPPVPVTVGEVLPGTVTAAVGWVLMEFGFQLYTSRSAFYDAYGIIGSTTLLLLWLYFGSFVLLFGVVVNVVLSDREVPSGGESDDRTGVIY